MADFQQSTSGLSRPPSQPPSASLRTIQAEFSEFTMDAVIKLTWFFRLPQEKQNLIRLNLYSSSLVTLAQTLDCCEGTPKSSTKIAAFIKQNREDKIRYYLRRFGDGAIKCSQSCSFSSPASQSNSSSKSTNDEAPSVKNTPPQPSSTSTIACVNVLSPNHAVL